MTVRPQPFDRPRQAGHLHLHLHGDGPIHRFPPEAKLVGLVAFVVVVALTPRRSVGALIIDAVIVAAVVALGRLPFRRVITRLVVILPFLSFAVLVPFIAGGDRIDVAGLSLSVEGLWAAWNVASKATIGTTASLVLASTTPVPDLLVGLGRLRLPTALVSIIAFMFRYLDLVIDQLTRTRQAMTARGHDPRWLWQARPLAMASGALFVRTYERGERVHGAMLARGWTGTMPGLDHDTAQPATWSTWTRALLPAVAALVALVAWSTPVPGGPS